MRVGTGHGPLGSWRAALIILLTHVSDISWRAPARRLCLLEPVTNAVSMFSNNRFVRERAHWFNPDQMFLVGHLSNDTPFYGPSVGTQPADIHLY